MPKIIHYRQQCIGCGICQEQQPEYWRMSRKDGKANLLNAFVKKEIYQLNIPESAADQSIEIAKICPVRVIKIV